MITLNDKYSFERDSECWHLHVSYMGKAAKGKESKMQRKTTYHGTLAQIADYIINLEAGKCESMTELKEMLTTAGFCLTGDIANLAG